MSTATPPSPSQDAPLPTAFDGARTMIAALPRLPSHLRYLDEYDDSIRTIANPASTQLWSAQSDTRTFRFDLTVEDDASVEKLLRQAIAWQITENSVVTAYEIYRGLRRIMLERGTAWFLAALERPIHEWFDVWETEVRASGDPVVAYAVKALLYFFCDMALGTWQQGHAGFVRTLRWPKTNSKSYQDVLSGVSILTTVEEALIIERLDAVSRRVEAGEHLPDRELLEHCLLRLSYEHGLRPIQMGRIDLANLRTHKGGDGRSIVHFTAFRAKKRNTRDKLPFVRKVKREWAAPFADWQRRRAAEQAASGRNLNSSDKAFPLPIKEIIATIGDTVEAVTGTRRTATDMRHSVAQRLVDSGASIEEVANFLGHSHWETSLIYFEASAAQGPLINKALAVSPIYSRIVEVARNGYIGRDALADKPSDNQIGAVPHGIPVSGIGACKLGQSLCSLNPALSCYTCRRFIPIDEPEIHREVLADFREVVSFFHAESRGERQSPAFVQLRIMLDAVQKVILDLEAAVQGAVRA